MTSMRHTQSVVFLLLVSMTTYAQLPIIKVLESGKRVSIRGLSVVNDNIIWVSGSGGSVARSTDGGNTFNWMKVPGYEKSDFRDIEAFDSNTAIIMGITTPAVILKTKDGGKNWKKVFEDTTKGAFFDAMDFMGNGGYLIGDPIGKKIFIAQTLDYGDTWKIYNTGEEEEVDSTDLMIEKDGEAFFASSGTNLKLYKEGDEVKIMFVSGGKSSRFYIPEDGVARSLPIMQGKESTGANSIDFFNYKQKGVIVGGDFAKDTISSNNCILFSATEDNISFTNPKTSPHGYRSCVIYLDEKHLLTCGTSGIDISKDGGMNWELISKESFHVCQKAKSGKAVFLAGGNGKIAKLVN